MNKPGWPQIAPSFLDLMQIKHFLVLPGFLRLPRESRIGQARGSSETPDLGRQVPLSPATGTVLGNRLYLFVLIFYFAILQMQSCGTANTAGTEPETPEKTNSLSPTRQLSARSPFVCCGRDPAIAPSISERHATVCSVRCPFPASTTHPLGKCLEIGRFPSSITSQ